MTLKEAQASLSERKFFVMKESPLFPAEKKTVPIKEYSILPPGQPKSLETLKCRDIRSHEPSSACGPGASEAAAAAAKSSLVLPPVKDAAPKNSLDPSSRKRQTTVSQASEKALSDTTSYTRAFKAKEPNWEKGSNTMYDALKEQIKMHEIASFVPRLAKTSFISRNLDQCYWHCSLFPDKKPGAMSHSIALRRHSHPNSVHFLHTKATTQVSKANGIQDHCIRSRSHTGNKQPRESKAPAEIPLLSGLFPSLTEEGWGRATPFTCCKIQTKAKKPKITKTISSISHRQRRAGLKKNMSRVAHLGRGHRKKDQTFTKKETISSNKEDRVSSIKHYNFVPVMTTKAEGEKRTGKLDSIQTFLGEKRTLPIKEYEIKYSQPPPGPQVFRYKEISLPKVIRDHPPSSLSCITLNAFLVFRADESGIINLHLEPLSNSKGTAVLRAEKEDSTLAETEPQSRTCTTKKMKQKNEKKVGRTNPRKKQIQKSCYHPWTGL
ncbi:hypothetical protein JRQ81_006326 [Phrynocephalus forsythii]|uniref:Uncharacterized protein n=1 Tax=Phrynocephalus forsythii TaxID=171643 RepID=A0A9Q1AUF8_9SAUR|nr:hypothetical protein JRQ81_006326 [Phrynocephalus forsythii]